MDLELSGWLGIGGIASPCLSLLRGRVFFPWPFSPYSEYVVILAVGLLELSTKVQYIKGLDSCFILKIL